MIEVQTRTLCPNWVKQRTLNPHTTREEHFHKYPDCKCGHSNGQQMIFSYISIDELRTLLAGESVKASGSADKACEMCGDQPARTGLNLCATCGDIESPAPAIETTKKKRGRPVKTQVQALVFPEGVDAASLSDVAEKLAQDKWGRATKTEVALTDAEVKSLSEMAAHAVDDAFFGRSRDPFEDLL